MQNVVEEQPYSILKELQKRQHYKQRGHQSFSAEQIRYVLQLCSTSKQAYKYFGKFSTTIFVVI